MRGIEGYAYGSKRLKGNVEKHRSNVHNIGLRWIQCEDCEHKN